MAGSDLVQSVLKALDILRLTAASPRGMRLNEISEALSMKPTTAHNLIRTLCARGFLSKDTANRYLPGQAIQELASLTARNTVMTRAVLLMRQLHSLYPRATLTFSEMTPGAIRCLLRMSPDRPGELQQPQEHVFQPYISPTAICLQATAVNAPDYEQIFAFADFGASTWKSYDNFAQQKERAKQRGYAEKQRGKSVAIAFAIPEKYAIGISMEISETEEMIAKVLQKIKKNMT